MGTSGPETVSHHVSQIACGVSGRRVEAVGVSETGKVQAVRSDEEPLERRGMLRLW
jgi:hypothetical protein